MGLDYRQLAGADQRIRRVLPFRDQVAIAEIQREMSDAAEDWRSELQRARLAARATGDQLSLWPEADHRGWPR